LLEPARLLHADLERRRGALDQRLEELRLHRIVLGAVPQAFPDLVRLPEVAVVVEVDAEEVVGVVAPARRREVGRGRLGLGAGGVAERIAGRVRVAVGQVRVAREGPLRRVARRAHGRISTTAFSTVSRPYLTYTPTWPTAGSAS